MFNSNEREQLEVVIDDLVDETIRLQKSLTEAQVNAEHFRNALKSAGFEEGTWDCGKGKCWYESNDMFRDQCVICGDSDERK